ncbi:Squalene epoxidase [Cynara cardunculus var. scolymus]|uniref:Squalene monooxygenase n=1 Tax=Cynara cardunculus var. scolymus TaxID=59895 RepID=A0A103XME6_CYNCS|nr:Squalene epoxidase [Cynara cardunculus var. scolymus]
MGDYSLFPGDGRRVHVLERDLAEPDRIVGEVLHPGGYMKLMELGLEGKILRFHELIIHCVEGIEAQRVSGYAFYLNGKTIRLDYPLGKFDSNVSGKSFHNGRFIQRMRSKASFLPNVKLEQGTVTSLLKTQGTVHGVHYRTKGGHAMTAYAPLTIVCDGCFSNLRRELCNPKIEVPSCFVALVLENVDLPYANHGHAIIADPSPVLFYSISNTKIRCLVDVPGEKVPSISNGEMTKTMPNKTMPAESKTTQGALLLGDALNMRHPLTGGGMTAALTDIVLLRDLLRPLHDLNDAYKHLQRFYTLRKASLFHFLKLNMNFFLPMSFTLNTVAGVGYKMFCASSDLVSRELRSACFSYLTLGHWFTDGLMAIFSGLDQRPVALFLQGTMMGAYIVGRLLMPFPSPKRLWLAAKLIPIVSDDGE